jgi:hypothetical protein
MTPAMNPMLLAGLAPAILIAAPAAAQDFTKELEALAAEHRKSYEALYAELDELEGAAAGDRYRAGQTEIDTGFQARFDELATRAANDGVAPKALTWVVRLNASGGAKSPECGARATRALDTLLSRHLASEALDGLAGNLMHADPKHEPYDAALRKIRAEAPSRLVQASALHALATRAYARAGDDDASRAEVRKLWDELKSEFGSLGSASGKSYGKLADATLFEFDHLQVGMPVPDVQATDETGTAFKLSDYRGKVVVVDFWGFW